MNRQQRDRLGGRGACGIAAVAFIAIMASCNTRQAAAPNTPTRPAAATEPAAGAPNAAAVDLPVVVSTGEKIDRVTLENGLVIEDLQRGSGAICLPSSTIRAKYSCRVVGGKVFDSTGPLAVQYDLPTMIRGWQDGLPGMLVGGTRRLIIPPALAYGDRALKDGEGTIVAPANSTLEYVIELVEVK